MRLIAHLQALRYDGFKFSNCCYSSSPVKVAMCARFSHYLNQLLTFNIIQNTRNQKQVSHHFLPNLTLAWLYQASLTMSGGGVIGRARVYFE